MRKGNGRPVPPMSEKLMPCPFCGGEAKIQGHGYETAEYRVYCSKCECSTPRWSASKANAIALWNRRAERTGRLIDIFVKDKFDGCVHRVGDGRHDSLSVRDGVVRYYNLQNGCGTSEDGSGEYEFVESTWGEIDGV